MRNMEDVIGESFAQYAGAVLQSRALVDVRDCLKPSARQIFYSMLLHKLTSDNPHKKTANAVGMAMADFYIHGDSSCEGVIMRAGQPFAMRYPIVDVKGNAGDLIESGDWAAPRYTESRLSTVADILFADIGKDVIADWRDNYDNTKQFPSVMPSKGFYNICNGSMGIGIGLASSIPQFNIKDVNRALETLLLNPEASFDEIYCAPDFATGGVLINEGETKDALRHGTGAACKLRAVVEYDSSERCLVVQELPYSVYTNTICGELEAIIESEENPGIDRFNDLTGKTPLLKIYLKKSANPDKILRYLYKNTSLQSYYGINFTMLDNGKFPRVFTWREALQSHINHEKEVYRRGFEYDLRKIEARIHIIDGLLKCLASIDEVVHTIKSSTSTAAASVALQRNFLLDEVQAKAVLDMKLARLAHLEVEKLEREKADLTSEANRIHAILDNADLFNNELITGWRAIAKKFGDARRTKILDLVAAADEEPTEIRSLQVSLTNHGNLIANEVSSLYTQKRGGVGAKIKLDQGEYIMASASVDSNEEILLFTNAGNVYHTHASNITLGEKVYAPSILPIGDNELIKTLTSTAKKDADPYIYFVTRNGIIKKSELSEFNMTRNAGMRAISLEAGDSIINVFCASNEPVGVLTESGNFVMFATDDIRAIGRAAKGVRAIKLNDGDYVVSARPVPTNTKFITSISANGLFKKTAYTEFSLQGRGTKGSKIQRVNEDDHLVDFIPLISEKEILIASTRSCIKLNECDIPEFSKGALGNKSIKLTDTDKVVKISLY